MALRLVISLGLGLLAATGGLVAAYLILEAVKVFSWQVFLLVVFMVSAAAFLVDLLSTNRTPPAE